MPVKKAKSPADAKKSASAKKPAVATPLKKGNAKSKATSQTLKVYNHPALQ